MSGTKYKENILKSFALDIEKARENPAPEILRIEATNACNHACLYCGNRKMTRPICFIDENIVDKALRQAYDMGVRKASFHTTGEPFLHPDLPKFIKMAKQTGFEYIFTNTNGGIVTEQMLQEAVEAGISSIAFSVDAINEKDYRLMHGRDDFAGVIEKLAWLHRFRREKGHSFNLYVSFIKTKFTSYPEEEIKRFFADTCDEVRIQNVQNIGGFCPEIDMLGVDSSDLFFHYEIPCRLLFKSVIVTCEGYLTACSVDFQNYLVYADLHQGDIQTAWNNDIMSNLRERHLAGDVNGLICDNCANNSSRQPQPLMKKRAAEFDMTEVLSPREATARIDKWRNLR